jgi:hypothetical protein
MTSIPASSKCFNRKATQLGNLLALLKADAPEQSRNLGSKAASRLDVLFDNVSQDVTDFRCHAVAVPGGPALQPFF